MQESSFRNLIRNHFLPENSKPSIDSYNNSKFNWYDYTQEAYSVLLASKDYTENLYCLKGYSCWQETKITTTKQSVLDSWKGYIRPTPNTPFGARRDFSRVGSNIKIEVKTTGNDNRKHSIENYLQLIEDPPEHIFLYSVAAKNDATGATTLPAKSKEFETNWAIKV